MNSNKIINLPNPQRDNEPVTKDYADTHYSGGGLSSSGFTMHGGINMNASRITYVPDPLTNP